MTMQEDLALLRQLEQSLLTDNPAQTFQWTNEQIFSLCIMILVFGLVICLIAGFLMHRGHPASEVLKLMAVLAIITLAVFLLPAGYSDQQIAPLMGLFGTIAGYILGKFDAEKNTSGPT